MANPYSTFETKPPDPAAIGFATSLAPSKRRRLNLVAIFINTLAPWITFCGIFAALSFSLHHISTPAAWSTVVIGAAMTGLSGFLAVRSKNNQSNPMWYAYSFLAVGLATVLGTVLGNMNYFLNMKPYYDIASLNTYPSVSPAREKGQQLMDAGRVYFTGNTGIDSTKAIGFRATDRYCVAPIISGSEPLASYDFWAVGVNCCSDTAADFRCGEYKNPRARSGLRMMRDDQRPFFRLAVQQAEAAYNIKAQHPLFFYWMQDPVAEMLSFRAAGFKYFLIAICAHFAFNMFCVATTVVGFAKMG
eukprot:TRINITY_DN475_c0_g1_i1.p1 TRINITY_DN475_c0_g1~~TRINITY_DN475_c0_g1_i1.p1  ORF type:complete len:303 (+),score=61.90 TRINITY_DN475_c0_g1_i1:65-973(+)